MHCSKCGAACASGLTYCPRCGAKLVAPDNAERSEKAGRPGKMLDNLAITIIFVSFFGFGSTFVMASELVEEHVSIWAVIFLTALMLATTFSIEVLLIRQISRVLDFSLNRKSVEEEKSAITERQMPEIESAPEYVSVTESTTRSLEPNLKDQN
ncbi:MAG: hypothetical protein AB1631_00595 [Acidobacteriota bacterium]